MDDKHENGRSVAKNFCEVNEVAWQWRAKKEIAQGWKWMRQQNPDATAEAERWAEENKEEMKDVDRILYRSDERYYGRSTSLDSEDAESMNAEGGYPDPEAFLPEDVRDRIYDDHAYVQNPYLPKAPDSDSALYLSKSIAAGLRDLTDLQREVIFRNVINGEDISSIAESKNCSTRNIRDIRNRALKALRAATAGKSGSGSPDAVLFVLWSLLLGAAAYFLLVPEAVEAWIRTAVFVALPIITAAAIWRIVQLGQNSTKRNLRRMFKKKRK